MGANQQTSSYKAISATVASFRVPFQQNTISTKQNNMLQSTSTLPNAPNQPRELIFFSFITLHSISIWSRIGRKSSNWKTPSSLSFLVWLTIIIILASCFMSGLFEYPGDFSYSVYNVLLVESSLLFAGARVVWRGKWRFCKSRITLHYNVLSTIVRGF